MDKSASSAPALPVYWWGTCCTREDSTSGGTGPDVVEAVLGMTEIGTPYRQSHNNQHTDTENLRLQIRGRE